MRFIVESKNLFNGLKAVDALYAGYSGYRSSDNTKHYDCVITATKSTIQDGDTVSRNDYLTLEINSNGLHIKKKVAAKVSEEGKMLVNSSILAGLPKQRSLTVEYNESQSRFQFEAGRTKGLLDTIQNGNFDVAPMFTVEATHDLAAKTLHKLFSNVAYKARTESKSASLNTPKLTCRIWTKGAELFMSSQDSFCASRSNVTLPKELGELDVKFYRVFFDHVMSSVKNDTIKMGVSERGFRIITDDLDITHPSVSIRCDDIGAWVEEQKVQKPIEAIIIFKADQARDSISETLSITNAATSSEREDGRIYVKLKNNNSVAKLNSEISFGKTDSSFELVECNVLGENQMLPVSLSGKILSNFLDILGTASVRATIWKAFILLENIESDTFYIMPTLSQSE